jgi:hypothetical protein
MIKMNIDQEFELMVNYQVSIESNSIVVRNDHKDKYDYTLYSIVKPYPSYEDYLNGNDFEYGKVLYESNNLDSILESQDNMRAKIGSTVTI